MYKWWYRIFWVKDNSLRAAGKTTIVVSAAIGLAGIFFVFGIEQLLCLPKIEFWRQACLDLSCASKCHSDHWEIQLLEPFIWVHPCSMHLTLNSVITLTHLFSMFHCTDFTVVFTGHLKPSHVTHVLQQVMCFAKQTFSSTMSCWKSLAEQSMPTELPKLQRWLRWHHNGKMIRTRHQKPDMVMELEQAWGTKDMGGQTNKQRSNIFVIFLWLSGFLQKGDMNNSLTSCHATSNVLNGLVLSQWPTVNIMVLILAKKTFWRSRANHAILSNIFSNCTGGMAIGSCSF